MGERKVLNKYFPPDFDPSIIPRKKRSDAGREKSRKQIEVRTMLPMSIQCDTCGEYMYRGKKFNSRKEDVMEETYHGIKIFRFYIKCVTCSAEITFKTDPENGDYKAEKGCSRNFEPWRERSEENAKALKERAEEEKNDSMKTLENRTMESKREMDILDALDEIRAINQRHERVDTQALLNTNTSTGLDKESSTTEQDLLAAKQAFANPSKKRPAASAVPTIPIPVVVKAAKMPSIQVKKKAKKTSSLLVAQYQSSTDEDN